MPDRILDTNGANPILPPDIYIPDGEPKVFGGRVYLYGSHDVFGGAYCCGDYHVFSASVDDLTKWTDHGVSFRSRDEYGNTADVPWSTADLYAPDVVKKGDEYYLYFCLSDGSEGVAVSDSPAGPFSDAKRITMDGKPLEGIDPSVLGDGGRFYYTWGQFSMKAAELNDDMCSLKSDTFHDAVITNNDGAHGFHEGSSLRKIGDKYCIIYASEWKSEFPNKSAAPTKLDYAVSDNIYGPYERKGTVVDNFGIDPKSWNCHGSVIKIGERWYVFYHGSSNNTEFNRRARVERIRVDEKNAVISRAEITSNGFLAALPVSLVKSPANACRFFSGAYITQRRGGSFPLVNIRKTGGCEYRYVRFAGGKYRLKVVYNPFGDCLLRVTVNGIIAADILLPADKTEAVGEFETESGDSVLAFTFFGGVGELCEVESFEIK
ncbi:MAG: family 43 glycosylhydrolase, partial [Clostridia bacterium]|nr:family 43 glycosylhydrolase [Clostridia bacterium]